MPRLPASSSHFRGVPYQFLPKTWAYSRNSPRATICSNSASEMKLYHSPLVSVARGERVVYETDHSMLGSSRIFFTRVDFPEPDGPETISTSGSDGFIRCSAPVRAIFQLRCRATSRAACWLRAAFLGAGSRVFCRRPAHPRAGPRIVGRGCEGARAL